MMLATLRCIDGHGLHPACLTDLDVHLHTHTLLQQGFEQAHRHTEVYGYDRDGENLNEKVYLILFTLQVNHFSFATTAVIVNPIKPVEFHDFMDNPF